MKPIFAMALAIHSSVCFSAAEVGTQPARSSWKQSHFPDSFHQHIGAAKLLAAHYCINKAWPRSIEELQIFAKQYQLAEADVLDWPLFLPPRGKLIFDEGIILSTPAGDEPTETPTTSSLAVTDCSNKSSPKISLKINATPYDKSYDVRKAMPNIQQ